MGIFQKWVGKGLYSCILVVEILRVKIGHFVVDMSLSFSFCLRQFCPLLFLLLLACSRLHRVGLLGTPENQ